MSLLKQNFTRKEQIDEKLSRLNFDTKNNKKFKVKAI